MNEFVAGTGGDSHVTASNYTNQVFKDGSDYGVLEFTLHAGSADFAFEKVGGGTGDSGTITCDPVVSGVSSSSGPLSGGNTVTVTGNKFVGTPTVHFGANAAHQRHGDLPHVADRQGPGGVHGHHRRDRDQRRAPGVSGPGPTSSTSPSDQYTYGLAPTVTSVSPDVGIGLGGQRR